MLGVSLSHWGLPALDIAVTLVCWSLAASFPVCVLHIPCFTLNFLIVSLDCWGLAHSWKKPPLCDICCGIAGWEVAMELQVPQNWESWGGGGGVSTFIRAQYCSGNLLSVVRADGLHALTSVY